eukprot:ANDGO_05176.mRNA.1 Phospholipase D Z
MSGGKVQNLHADFVLAGVFGLIAIIVLSVALSQQASSSGSSSSAVPAVACGESCQWQLVESIPQYVDLQLPPNGIFTHDALLDLVQNAQSTIHIAAFYFRLLEGCDPSSQIGNGQWGCQLFQAITNAHARGVKVMVAQSLPDASMQDPDSLQWSETGAATVVNVSFPLIYGGGVLHTKFLVADSKDLYLGSCNFDWTSLAQVKELGILVRNCPCVASDLLQIWKTYEYLGLHDMRTPSRGWSPSFGTPYNNLSLMTVPFQDGSSAKLFLSAAPPVMETPGRMFDLDALVGVIDDAQLFVNISVMDFYPNSLYGKNVVFWPTVIVALQRAMVERSVKVNVMVAKWNHSSEAMYAPLKALQDFSNLCMNQRNYTLCSGSAKSWVFQVPELPNYESFPYTRVNHAKFMVTDRKGFITTSNWSYDYYFNTAGVSMVVDHEGIRGQLQYVFTRDQQSQYVISLDEYLSEHPFPA